MFPHTCIVKFIPLDTPVVAMSMNAVIGDVINRNRPGSCFVPGGLRASCEAT
jgi:hypothetical protein